MKTVRFLLFALVALVAFGCQKNDIDTRQDPTKVEVLPDGRLKVPLNFIMPQPEQVQTRSTNTDDENTVSNIWVVVFEAPTGTSITDFQTSDRLVQIKEATAAGIAGNFVILDPYVGNCRMRMLVNVSSTVETILRGYKTVSQGGSVTTFGDYMTIADVLGALYDDAAADATPVVPFPMSSEGVFVSGGIDENTIIPTLILDMIYARIDVKSEAAGFTLSGAALQKGANQGFYRPQASLTENQGGSTVYALKPATSGEVSPIYLYPNSGGTEGSNATEIIVRGTLSGYPEGYYKIRLYYGNNDPALATYDINRNTLYTVTLKSIKGAGYASLAQAQANTPNNIEYDVTVNDNSSSDVVITNGQYYMGLSNSEVWYYGFPSGNKTGTNLKVTTVTLGAASSQSLPAAGARTITATTGITITPASLTAFRDAAGGATVDIMADFASTAINGSITVRCGDLVKTIPVKVFNYDYTGTSIAVDGVTSAEIIANTDDFLRINSSASYPGTYVPKIDYGTAGTTAYLITPAIELAIYRYATAYFSRTESAGRLMAVITQGPLPGGYADVLYFASDGTLQCGGLNPSYQTVTSGGTSTSAEPFTFARQDMAFFKFGSVVGFTNNNDSWADTHVKFNPVTPGGGYAYASIPVYADEGGPTSPYGGEGFISSSAYHNYTNVITKGKGDPCKLVGKTAAQINAMTKAEFDNYNSGWRLPTSEEQADYCGLSGATAGESFNNGSSETGGTNQYPHYGSSSGIFTTAEGSDVSPARGYFPIGGGTKATENTGRYFNSTAPYLPAAGYRLPVGAPVLIGVSGNYWSGTATFTYGYSLTFHNHAIYPRNYSSYASGLGVRCVRQ